MAKITTKEYKKRVKTIHPTIAVLGDYVNTSTRIKHKCRSCRHEWKEAPTNVTHSTSPTGCPSCAKPSKKFSLKGVDAKLSRHGFKRIGPYSGMNQTMKVRCSMGHEFSSFARNSMSGMCRQCGIESTRTKLSHPYDQFRKALRRRFPHITCIEYGGLHVRSSRFQCNEGHIFTCEPFYMLKKFEGVYGCPVCDKKVNQSGIAINCIETIAKRSRLGFEHARNTGEFKEPNTGYKVDGYNRRYNIVIEFHGDYYHSVKDKTAQRYLDTIRKDAELAEHVNLITVWEWQWKKDPIRVLRNAMLKIDRVRHRR